MNCESQYFNCLHFLMQYIEQSHHMTHVCGLTLTTASDLYQTLENGGTKGQQNKKNKRGPVNPFISRDKQLCQYG